MGSFPEQSTLSALRCQTHCVPVCSAGMVQLQEIIQGFRTQRASSRISASPGFQADKQGRHSHWFGCPGQLQGTFGHCHCRVLQGSETQRHHGSGVLIAQPPAFPCSLCVPGGAVGMPWYLSTAPVGTGTLQSWVVPLVGTIRLIPCHWFIVLRGHCLNRNNNYLNTIYHLRPSFKNLTNPNQFQRYFYKAGSISHFMD